MSPSCSEADRGAPVRRRWPTRSVDDRSRPGDRELPAGRQDHRRRQGRPAADGIHPGYGFLAENAEFAEAVGKRRPDASSAPRPTPCAVWAARPEAKRDCALRPACRWCRAMPGDNQTPATLAKEAKRIGYPVMIKAVAGGGGRGMRLVEREADFAAALDERRSARPQAAFGDARVLLGEGDRPPAPHRGAGVRRQPRQRRASVRARLLAAAPQPEGDRRGPGAGHVARAARRRSPLRPSPAPRRWPTRAPAPSSSSSRAALSPAAPWYFIEMNTRLQVEHPVTEAITGLDLVEWQLRVAAGETAAAAAGRNPDVGPRHRGHGSAPRIPAAASCRRRGRSRPSRRRNWRACASMPASRTGSVISPHLRLA